MDNYLRMMLVICVFLIIGISIYRRYTFPKSIKRKISLDNLRLAKTEKGNIIIVIAYDYKEQKCVVGKFDMKLLKFTLGKLPVESLYIYSLTQMESLTIEKSDSNGDIRGGLGYLMNTGIPFHKDWGLFDWTKVSKSNKSSDKENTEKGMMDVVVLVPPHLSDGSSASISISSVDKDHKKSQ